MAKKRTRNRNQVTDTFVTETGILTDNFNFDGTKNETQNDSVKIKKINIEFKTEAQKNLWDLIESKEITFVSGPAGTGKSHMCMLKALDLIKKFPRKYKKIVISKPAVETSEKLGFLPGDVDSKLAPFLYSSKYIFDKILGKEKVARMIERGQIEVMALSYIRGINLDNCIFILEEAQNCDKKLIRTILTRIGENCKYIINGDTTQVDIQCKIEQTGLYIAIQKLKDIPQIGIFEFADSDIIRNPLISVILERLNGEFK